MIHCKWSLEFSTQLCHWHCQAIQSLSQKVLQTMQCTHGWREETCCTVCHWQRLGAPPVTQTPQELWIPCPTQQVRTTVFLFLLFFFPPTQNCKSIWIVRKFILLLLKLVQWVPGCLTVSQRASQDLSGCLYNLHLLPSAFYRGHTGLETSECVIQNYAAQSEHVTVLRPYGELTAEGQSHSLAAWAAAGAESHMERALCCQSPSQGTAPLEKGWSESHYWSCSPDCHLTSCQDDLKIAQDLTAK